MLVQWCFSAGPTTVMARRRGGCCSRLPLNEDNARFCLLAGLILFYLMCGAAIFSALERPSELLAHLLWDQQLANFTRHHRVSRKDLHMLLRQYEEANGAGIRVDALRPRWDFSGAFYFVGTVVSTIGELGNCSFFSPPPPVDCNRLRTCGFRFVSGRRGCFRRIRVYRVVREH